MEMKEFIEKGEKKAGSQKELAEYLGTRYTTLVAVKAGRKSLTTALCIKLARYINEDEIKVIAASNLIIEKDEERKKIFESCLSWFVVVIFASVLTVMTPSPAEASKYQDLTALEDRNSLYYVQS